MSKSHEEANKRNAIIVRYSTAEKHPHCHRELDKIITEVLKHQWTDMKANYDAGATIRYNLCV